ncbi:WD repeat-containing protein 87-like [Armigeres subalbatus]|uniref:WD repeat-containing protein 87-like n=1 Tax=Armigeres subalbatus TaxID=124917 RepID=UPI002ED292D4
MTACGSCGTTSEVDEQMIGCDNCDRWFHTRCVGVTAEAAKENKWFCPSTECQQQYSEYLKKLEKEEKKKKSSKKNKAVGEEFDRASNKSSKSVNDSGSELEKRLKELEDEQQAKERKMEIEMIILQKRIEMETALKEKKMKLENAIRAKQRHDEKVLMEKALSDEKKHLEELKKMRDSFEVKMCSVRKEVKEMQLKEEGSQTKEKALGTPLRNPEVVVQKQLEKEQKEKKKIVSRREQESDDSEEDSVEEEEEEEDTVSDEESEEESEQRRAPTRAQMAARNGVTKKLPVFTGRPEEWPLFIGTYEASNEACGFTDVENLVRLQESLNGPALESVRGQLLFPKSVSKFAKRTFLLTSSPRRNQEASASGKDGISREVLFTIIALWSRSSMCRPQWNLDKGHARLVSELTI